MKLNRNWLLTVWVIGATLIYLYRQNYKNKNIDTPKPEINSKSDTSRLDKSSRLDNKSIELKATRENEIKLGLSKLVGKSTPKSIIKLDTKVVSNKQVLSEESKWNTSVINFLKKERKVPAKWLTDEGFPMDLKQYRKEWEEFFGKATFGTGRGETGVIGDKKRMSKYYYYIKLL